MLTTQRHDRRVRRQAGLLLEPLDDRVLLSWGARGAMAEALVHHQPAIHAHREHDISSREVRGARSPAALPANVSGALRSLYREYEAQVRDSRLAPSLSGDGLPSIRGFEVAVRIKVAFPPPWVRPPRAPRGWAANHSHCTELRAGRRHAIGRQVAGRSAGHSHVWSASLPMKR